MKTVEHTEISPIPTDECEVGITPQGRAYLDALEKSGVPTASSSDRVGFLIDAVGCLAVVIVMLIAILS